jgi:hypothetical protein
MANEEVDPSAAENSYVSKGKTVVVPPKSKPNLGAKKDRLGDPYNKLTAELDFAKLLLPVYEIQLPHVTNEMRNQRAVKGVDFCCFSPLFVLCSPSLSISVYILIDISPAIRQTLQGVNPTRNRNLYLSPRRCNGMKLNRRPAGLVREEIFISGLLHATHADCPSFKSVSSTHPSRLHHHYGSSSIPRPTELPTAPATVQWHSHQGGEEGRSPRLPKCGAEQGTPPHFLLREHGGAGEQRQEPGPPHFLLREHGGAGEHRKSYISRVTRVAHGLRPINGFHRFQIF